MIRKRTARSAASKGCLAYGGHTRPSPRFTNTVHYELTLQRLAKERCGGEFKVVILAPKQRKEEINKELVTQGVSSKFSIFLDWQSIMEDLESLAVVESGEVDGPNKSVGMSVAQRVVQEI